MRALLYHRSNGALTVGGEELLSVWRSDSDTLLWVDFGEELTEPQQRRLLESFALHPLAIQDALRQRHPPKLETFEDSTFLLLKELAADADGINFATVQLAVFLGERLLVTRHAGRSTAIDELFAAAAAEAELWARGAGAVALRLCRLVINRYLKILFDLEPRLEALEGEIMRHPRDEVLGELLSYKTELKKFRRVFLYHQQIFAELKSTPPPALGVQHAHQIIDVYEQQERAGSLAALYYELASDLIDGYISVASHHLNQIMKVLTVVMAIFVPLSFLAGIYGMNFENMPELHSRSGYYILLGIMLTIVVVLLTLFRKKRWL